MAEKKKGFDLAAALGSVSKLDTEAEGREQLQYIHMDYIHPDERNFYELSGVDELAANIEMVGLQQPLRVRADNLRKNWYIIVSGHRRFAALQSLAREGKENYDRFSYLPCIVEQPSAGADDEVDAMLQELRLIYGNSDTRRMSSADISRQAEKVEMLLYRLKEAGVEFPGRMRDHVAEACKVSASRLGRLKVIRENLDGEMKEQWEAGDLNESEAYNLAKLPPDHRAVIWAHRGKNSWGYAGAHAVEQYGARFRMMDASKIPVSCPSDKCDNLAGRREASFQAGIYYDSPCEHCCLECPKLGNCKYACSHLSKEIAAQKEQAAAAKKADKEMEAAREKKRKEEEIKQRSFALDCWKRLGAALELSGKSALWLAEGLDWHQSEVEDISPLLERGEVTDDNEYWADGCPLDNSSFMDIVNLADDLGVSVDYLLCRTDEPGMVKAAPAEVSADTKPQWQTGQPFRSGQYYCLLECEGQRMSMRLRWFDSYLEWHMPSGGHLTKGCEVVGWWPLPEDESDGIDRTEGEES